MKDIIDRLDRIIDILTTVKEEKEPSPRTPYREKEETGENNRNARTREKFVKPTLEEVAAYMREKGYAVDAEEFWNFYESKGWRVGRSPMRSWKSACVTWQKKRERDARTEDARIAHIDAKMDEREARREARAAQKSAVRRRPDNWIGCSDAERKEFIDGLA